MPEPNQFALDPTEAPTGFSLVSRTTSAFTAHAVDGLPGLARHLL
ncbi:hypothetical protein SANTM175S_06063 [Streptomyces antimycoticus]